jgi:hypothetical protein
MNAFPPLMLASCEHPSPPATILVSTRLSFMSLQGYSPGVSQDWPIGLYAVANPAINATDMIIVVSELNFMIAD